MKPLYAKEITSSIVDLAKKSGYTLKIDDATFITNASLNNYDMAYNTLEKIFLYYNNPCNIETTIVHNLTSMSLEDNNFKFVDAVVRNDLNTINKMIKDFKIQKIEPLALFNLIAREYRRHTVRETVVQDIEYILLHPSFLAIRRNPLRAEVVDKEEVHDG